MGTRRLAETEFDFLIKLHSLFRGGYLMNDRMLPVYIQIPGDPRMFTQIDTTWKVIIDDGCNLRKTKSYEDDEVLDAIHADGVSVYVCARWNLGTLIRPLTILHDCHNRGWRKTV